MEIALTKDVDDLGQEQVPEGRGGGAVARFGRTLSHQPAHAGAYHHLVRAFLTNHPPDGAVDCIRHGLATGPNVAQVRYWLAETVGQFGDRPHASEPYRRNRALRPGWQDTAMEGAKG